MSIETWKKEFYPKKITERMSKKQAVLHSLKKWIGLRDKNLKKHGLEKDYCGDLVENGECVFVVGSSSCALCVKYYYSDAGSCKKCPLYNSLGIRCDFGDKSPYIRYRTKKHSPEPMIAALEKVLVEIENANAR